MLAVRLPPVKPFRHKRMITSFIVRYDRTVGEWFLETKERDAIPLYLIELPAEQWPTCRGAGCSFIRGHKA
jgi:hypothetical protein